MVSQVAGKGKHVRDELWWAKNNRSIGVTKQNQRACSHHMSSSK